MSTKMFGTLVPRAALKIPRDYEGYVFISDIDKTYLATQIDSLGGLLKAAFETAERKTNVPGFSILLRALRRGGLEEPQKNPLFFVSASPPQMQRKILNKMDLDGIEHDGVLFKDQLEHVKRANFKKLKEQVGYKLYSLIALWLALPKKSKVVLFGDDSESDAVIYSIFSELLRGAVYGKDLVVLLRHLGVFREESIQVAWIARHIEPALENPVKAIFINLQTGSQASYYSRFGNSVFGTENTLQTALALYERGLVRIQAVKSIGRDLVFHHDYEPQALLVSLEGAARRGMFSLKTLDTVWPILAEVEVLPEYRERPTGEGAVSPYNALKISNADEPKGPWTLFELKKRFSNEGRY